MARNKSNKNKKYNKSSNSKNGDFDAIQTDQETDKPTRGLPRI